MPLHSRSQCTVSERTKVVHFLQITYPGTPYDTHIPSSHSGCIESLDSPESEFKEGAFCDSLGVLAQGTACSSRYVVV